MIDFPCIECTGDCDERESIQCANCRDWVHRDCGGITETELKEWARKSLKFHCKRCSFRDGLYDAKSALQRLKEALESRKPATLVNAAKSEMKLLHTYHVGIPEQQSFIQTGACDAVSIDILRRYHPVFLERNLPMSVVGDGNCLYRAVSRALTGSEESHEYLRLVTAIEIVLNKKSYDDTSETRLADLFNDNRVVTSQYQKLVFDAVVINSYSEMAHIYALSAALKMTIRSYYPPQLHPELSSEPFTRVVVGRGLKSNAPDIAVMWTQMVKPTGSFTPNHFVPLMMLNTRVERVQLNVSSSSCDSDANTSVTSIDDNSIIEADETSVMDESNVYATNLESVNEQNKGNLTTGVFLETKECVNILLRSNSTLLHVPGGLKENVYFVLENSNNLENRSKNSKSNFPDDCGVWNTASGTSPKSYYLLHGQGDLKKIHFYKGKFCNLARVKNQDNGRTERQYVHMTPQPHSSKVVVVHRYYTSLKTNSSYKKRVTWLGDGGLQSRLAVVEYIGNFPGLAPHGNATANTQYLRVPSYVMTEASDRLKTDKPKQVFNYLKKKYDEVTRPAQIQQLRDKKKYDKKKGQTKTVHNNNIADHFQQLETMVQQNHPFIRSIIRNNGKAPCVVLYSDEQITDLMNLCCTGQTFIGVDKTFNLIDMHVTVTSYKQLTVTRPRTGQSPLFLGPMFIHDNSDYETYSYFFHHLKLKMGDADLTKLVIGSDDERALVKAITEVFPKSTHALCTRHLLQNAKQKLTDDAVNVTDRNSILDKIFGDGGVLDADDTICFEEKCDEIEDQCSEISRNFVGYFQNRLRNQLRTKVNKPSRDGHIGDRWTNNNSESVNHVLKQAVDFRSKPLTDFIHIVQDLVDGQFKDLRSALLGAGELRLAESHKQFEVTKTDWITKTADQRVKLYKRFRNFVASNSKFVMSTDGQTTVVAPRTHGKKPGQRKRKINERTRTVKKTKFA